MCTWKIINILYLYTFYNLFLKLMKVKIYFSDPPIKSINSTWKKFKILKSVNFTGDIAFPHFFYVTLNNFWAVRFRAKIYFSDAL